MKKIWKMCKRCNAETEHYKSGHCKPCVISRKAKDRLENIDLYRKKEAERAASWRAANPDKVREINAKSYEKNAEKIKATKALQYAADPEKYRTRRALRYEKNPESHKKSVATWRANNKEACRIHDNNRRLRIIKNGGKLSKGLVDRLIKLQRGRCACCGMPLGDNYHLDHIIPIKLGGLNVDRNIQLLRAECNLKKQAKHPVYFMQQRGFLL